MKHTLLLLTFTALASSAMAQPTACSELFFSEYIEGSSQNKALEIYNPTNASIDLSLYAIKRYSNGATGTPDVLMLTGTIAPYDVTVVTNGQLMDIPNSGSVDTALYDMGDIHANPYPDPLYMNGDDAITLEKGNLIVDIVGEVGVDPGSAWTDDATANYTDANGGPWWTRDHTLIRKASVTGGVLVNPSPFNVTLEWDSLPRDTWTNLGVHDCACDVNSVNEAPNGSDAMFFFPNPAEGGEVLIKSTAGMKAIAIYNTVGEVVFEDRFAGIKEQLRINVSNFNAGIYLVRTELENSRSITQRLTIK